MNSKIPKDKSTGQIEGEKEDEKKKKNLRVLAFFSVLISV